MSTTLTHPSAQSALRSTARQDGVAAVLRSADCADGCVSVVLMILPLYPLGVSPHPLYTLQGYRPRVGRLASGLVVRRGVAIRHEWCAISRVSKGVNLHLGRGAFG